MISALIAWGIGFGGPQYLPTHGFSASSPPESSHRIYRLDQLAAGGDLYGTGPGAGSARVFRSPLFDDQPGNFDDAPGDFDGYTRSKLYR